MAARRYRVLIVTPHTARYSTSIDLQITSHSGIGVAVGGVA
jgi:hypothetical protein